MSTDPLEGLLVSESQTVNRQELANLLAPFISINKETHILDFSSRFSELSNTDKILIVLCGVKARSLVLGGEDKLSPSEIINMDIAPAGSIKSSLKILLEAGQIKAQNAKYFLPNYKVQQVVKQFSNPVL